MARPSSAMKTRSLIYLFIGLFGLVLIFTVPEIRAYRPLEIAWITVALLSMLVVLLAAIGEGFGAMWRAVTFNVILSIRRSGRSSCRTRPGMTAPRRRISARTRCLLFAS